jgi:cytochrome c peroxidase
MRTAIPALLLAAAHCLAQALAPLSTVRAPEPPGLDRYVRDRDALVALGKALFWDMQVGSDNRTACATCHFHAGADHRATHQLAYPSGPVAQNHTLAPGDFPFRVFADPGDNRSAVLRDSSHRAGSAGVFRRVFAGLAEGAEEAGEPSEPSVFRIGDLAARQVTPRNTPSVIDAVFNRRNLWDGRASDIFSGATPFGESDPGSHAMALSEGKLVAEKVRIANSSLASQAVGPPLNPVEMSYEGRNWPTLARKMLAARPLAAQRVATDDSVLGSMVDPEGRGLKGTYLDMVRTAFQPTYWDSTGTVNEAGTTQAEFNFPLFFGLAIQAYESTLVSGESRFDRFLQGDGSALTAREQEGRNAYQRGECSDCHLGAELTTASFGNIARQGLVVRLRTGFTTDTGFLNTGVRPASEDSGMLDTDEFGTPFSLAVRQDASARAGLAGTFKVPGLRNIELTGPYFHNGGQATLDQVVEFYNRGADFPAPNLAPDIGRQNLSAADRAALVEFLKSMTDDRVRFERAPFDHPELCVPVGHDPGPDSRYPKGAADRWALIPAVGRLGAAAPLQTFDEPARTTWPSPARSRTPRGTGTGRSGHRSSRDRRRPPGVGSRDPPRRARRCWRSGSRSAGGWRSWSPSSAGRTGPAR